MSDVGFELIDDGGEDWIREAVKRSPLGVAQRSFHGPYVFGGEGAEGGDGEFGGGGRRGVVGRSFAFFVGRVGGDVGEDGGDGEEEKRRGGGGG